MRSSPASLATAQPHPAGPALTWLEILPVLHDGGAIRCLRPRRQASWRVPHDGGPVARSVSRELAGAGLRAVVVHSTSWRQECEAVLLTHLAVLLSGTVPGPEFELRRVRRRELARGGATRPPDAVDVDQVLEHALRHLAWLQLDDRAVRAALEPAWTDRLHGYRPEPFRVFENPPPRG
jgi:hypothetical protein